MSEEESIAYDVNKIAEVLGSEAPIYVGKISVHGILTGEALKQVETAKKARIIADKDPTDKNPIERTITKLIGLVDENQPDQELVPQQKEAVAKQISTLVGLSERAEDGREEHGVIIKALFDAYFDTQAQLAETSANHYLRVAGDDYSFSVEYDFDASWALYQQALEEHERRHYY